MKDALLSIPSSNYFPIPLGQTKYLNQPSSFCDGWLEKGGEDHAREQSKQLSLAIRSSPLQVPRSPFPVPNHNITTTTRTTTI
jgi:hypothetical protein